MDGRFWMKTQTRHYDVVMMWWGVEHSMQCSPSADITEYLKSVYVYCILFYWRKVEGPALDLEVKLRSGQSSSWKTAGQFLAKLILKAWVLILAVVLTYSMDFGNSLHPPQRDGDHSFLFCRTVLTSLNVWYRVGGCINYGHHFMTFNHSWWNPNITI